MMQMYATPQDVFDAYRAALNKHDWRELFLCLDAESQSDAVYETFFCCCNLVDDIPKFRTLLSAHGVDEQHVRSEYEQRFRKKYKINPSKMRDAVQSELPACSDRGSHAIDGQEPTSWVPDIHQALMRDIVCSLIKDKLRFYVEAQQALDTPGIVPPLHYGTLQRVTTEDNVAVGYATVTSYHLKAERGAAAKPIANHALVAFHFVRTGSGWLLRLG